MPTANNTYDLGSPANYWQTGYINELNVNTLAAASTTISGTSASTFTINSDNATNDTEDQSLVFFRGLASPNAVLSWNSTSDQFEFNMNTFVDGDFDVDGNISGNTITPDGFTLGSVVFSGVGGVLSQDNANFFYDNTTNRLGLGTSTPAVVLDVYGTDAIRLPVGTSGQRPAGDIGYVRFNTTTHQFEGYGDNGVWQGLGGVIDADQDTYVTADTNNTDEDTLRFFTRGVERMTITPGGKIGIGTNAPNASSILDLSTTTAGLLFPRLTTIEKDAIVSPAAGLAVYDSTVNKLNVYNGSAWKNVGATEINGEVTNGTTGSVLFVGDGGVLGQDVSNFNYSTSTGRLGIGTTTPWGVLSVNAPAGQPSFVVGSSTATSLVVAASGFVGMGVSNPLTELHIKDNVSGASYLTLQGISNSHAGGIFLRQLNDTGTDLFYDGGNDYFAITRRISGTVQPADFVINNAAALGPVGGVWVGTTTSPSRFTVWGQGTGTNPLFSLVNSASTTLMQVLDNGNVGIGSTTPGATFGVQGSGLFSGNLSAANFTATGTASVGALTLGGSTFTSLLGNALTNVGGVLAVSTSSLASGFFQQDGNSFGTTAVLGTNDANTLAFETSGTTRMTIDTSGNVGIGAVASGARLQVNSAGDNSNIATLKASDDSHRFQFFLDGSSNAQLFLGNAGGTNTLINSGGSSYFNGGSLGIGTTTPSATLAVNSTAGATAFAIGSSTGTQFIIDANNKIGVGTSSPQGGIDLNNGTGLAGGINLWNQTGPSYQLGRIGYTNGPTNILKVSTAANVGGTNQDIQLETGPFSGVYVAATGQVGIGYTSNFATANGTQLVVDGRLGLGTSTPQSMLDIETGGRNTGNTAYGIRINNTDTGSLATNLGYITGGAMNWITGTDYKGNNSSNFFIGTSTNGYTPATMYGPGATVPFEINSEGTVGLQNFGSSPSITAGRLYQQSGSLYFNGVALAAGYFGKTGSTISPSDISDNLGLGTTTTSARLGVDGNILANHILPNGTYTDNLSAYDLGATGARWNAVWAGALNIGTSTFSLKSDSASNLGFYTAASGGGTQAMTIATGGNVGIGTTTPYAPLSVAGGLMYVGTSGATKIVTNRIDQSSAAALGSGTVGNYLTFDSAHPLFIGTDSLSNIQTNGSISGQTTAMTVATSGNVGIGTTSPAHKLAIEGTTSAEIGLRSSAVNNAGVRFIGTTVTGLVGIGDGVLGLRNGNSGDYQLNITSAGNVGIGTTTPDTRLTVGGGGNTGLRIENTSGQAGTPYLSLRNYRSGGKDWWMFPASSDNAGTPAAGALQFYNNTDGVYAMTLTSAGNVGIGTTSPQSNLVVQGSGTGHVSLGAWTGSNAYGGISLNGSTAFGNYNFYSTASDGHLYINRPTGSEIRFRMNNSVQDMTLSSTGTLSVLSSVARHEFKNSGASNEVARFHHTGASNPGGISVAFDNNPNNTSTYFFAAHDQAVGYKFLVYSNGNVVNTNNSYGAYSDSRLKNVVGEMGDVLDDFNQVSFKDYQLIAEGPNAAIQSGVIAQEILPIFPQIVSTGSDGYYSVNYAGLSLLTSKALQELSAKVDALMGNGTATTTNISFLNATTTTTDTLCLGGDCRSSWPTIASTTLVDLSGYALLANIPDVSSFVSTSTLASAIAGIPATDLSSYATTASVTDAIAAAIGGIATTSAPDLSGYALLSSIPDITGLVSTSTLAANLSGYASTASVSDAITSAIADISFPTTDLSSYARLTDLSSYARLTDLPDLSGFVSTSTLASILADMPAAPLNGSVNGSIIPQVNNLFDLGSPTNRFANIYGNNIVAGDVTYTETNNNYQPEAAGLPAYTFQTGDVVALYVNSTSGGTHTVPVDIGTAISNARYGSNNIFLNTTGSVAIGISTTTTPRGKLNVEMNAGSGDTRLLTLANTGATGALPYSFYVPSTGDLNIASNDNSNGSTINASYPSWNVKVGGVTDALSIQRSGAGVSTSYSNLLSLSNTGVLTTGGLTSTGTSTATYFAASTLGTVGAPAFTFSGDVNTGLWSPAADTLAWSTGGAERMRVDSSGNVGIGTTSPARTLSVQGTIGVYSANNGAAASALGVSSTDSGFLNLLSGGVSTALIGTNQASYFNGGNVGIGTTTPGSLLNIAANDGVAVPIRFTQTGTATRKNWQIGSQINVNDAFEITPSTTNGGATYSTPAVTILSSGNVGIGQNSPDAGLHVVKQGSGSYYSSNIVAADTVAPKYGYYASGVGYQWSTRVTTTGTPNDGQWVLRYESGSADILTATRGGNIGIGTTTPQGRFHVKDATTGTTVMRAEGTGNGFTMLADGYSGADSQVNLGVKYSTAAAVLGWGAKPKGTANEYVSSQGVYSAQPAAIEVGGGGTSSAFRVFANNTSATRTLGSDVTMSELMRVTTAGNVGIGAASPARKFVVSNGDAQGFEFGPGEEATVNYILNYNRSNAQYLTQRTYALDFQYYNGGTHLMTLDSSGKLGVGVAPSYKLHTYSGTSGATANSTYGDDLVVEDDSSTGLTLLSPDANWGSLYFASPSGSNWIESNYTAGSFGFIAGKNGGAMSFYTNNGSVGERMRLSSAGNLALGAATASYKLHLKGTGDQYIGIESDNGGDQGVWFRNAGTSYWRLYNHANTNLYLLDSDFSNGVYITQNSNSWTAYSDERLKDNIQNVSVLDRLENYRAVSFDWKSTGNHDIGVIAQEIYDVFPEVVTVGSGSETGTLDENNTAWGVMYDKLGPLALQGVKELNEKVNALAGLGTATTTNLTFVNATSTNTDTLIAGLGTIDTLCLGGECRSSWPTIASSTPVDLSGYALLANIPDVSSFVSTSTLAAAIAGIPATDLSSYATTASVTDAIASAIGGIATSSAPDLSSYATLSDLSAATSSIYSAIAAIPVTDLTGYARLTDIPDVSNFVSSVSLTSTLSSYARLSDLSSLVSTSTLAAALGNIPSAALTGTITGDLIPDTDRTYSLGSPTNRLENVYAKYINAGDLTWTETNNNSDAAGAGLPSYTFQQGDMLAMYVNSTSGSTHTVPVDIGTAISNARYGSNNIFLNTTGSVAIGVSTTTTPRGKLDVEGSLVGDTRLLTLANNSATGALPYSFYVPSSGDLNIASNDNSNGSTINAAYSSWKVRLGGATDSFSIARSAAGVSTSYTDLFSISNTGAITASGLNSTATSTATYFAASTLGTVGAPAFTFSGDVNTGLWSPAADTLAVSTGGTERLRVTSAGNLGIGTTTPDNALAAYVSGSAKGIAIHGSVPAITFTDTSNRKSALYFSGGDMYINNEETGGMLQLRTQDQARVTIGATGNVGIGNAGPLSLLHVGSLATGAGSSRVGGTTAALGFEAIYDQTGDTTTTLYSNPTYTNTSALMKLGVDGDANPNQLVLKGNGYIGIANSNPLALLHVGPGADANALGSNLVVTNAGNTSLSVRDSSNDVELFNYAYSGGGIVGTLTNHSLVFRTSNADRITIAAGGNVNVGSVTANELFSVGGNISLGNGGSNGIILYETAAGVDYAKITNVVEGSGTVGIALLTNTSDAAATEKVRITGTGRVGIGTTTPSYTLDTLGGIRASGGAGGGHITLQPGNGSSMGYVEWYKPNQTRAAYMGFTDTSGNVNNLELRLENSANFDIMNGFVGIGTTTSNAPLTVYAGATVGLPSGANMTSNYTRVLSLEGVFPSIVFGSNYSTDRYGMISYDSSGGFVMFVNSTTADASNTGTGAKMAFAVSNNGNAQFNGTGGTCTINGSGACSSDMRLKENIADISGADALAGLAKINGVTYDWRDESLNQAQRVGVVAQDVLEAFPQLVETLTTTLNGVEGEYYAVNYGGLTAPLISAVNYLGERVAALEGNGTATTTNTQFINATSTNTDSLSVAGTANIGTICLGTDCRSSWPTIASSTPVDLSGYALLANIPDVSSFVSTSTLASAFAGYAQLTDIPDVSGFVSTSTLASAIAAIPATNLSSYATTASVGDAITLALSGLTAPDLSPYALLTDIPDVSGFVTSTDLASAIGAIEMPDLSDYARLSDIPSAVSLANLSGTISGDLIPDTDRTYNLGSPTNRLENVYAKYINAGDLTWTETGNNSDAAGAGLPSYTFQQGDMLAMYVNSTSGSTHTVPVDIGTAISNARYGANNIYFNTTGSVAIGVGTTTNPRGKLNVEMNAGSGDTRLLTLANTGATGALPYSFYVPSTGDLNIASNDNSNGSTINASYPSWNVKVGGVTDAFSIQRSAAGASTSYSNLLSVSNTGVLTTSGLTSTATSTATYFAASTLGTVGAPAFTFSGDVNTGLWSPAADTLAWSTGGAERVRVDSSGNVGIGTTTPTGKLSVSSASGSNYILSDSVASAEAGYGIFKGGAAKWYMYSPSNSDDLRFYAAGDRMSITNGGNVGIGTTTPANRLTLDTSDHQNVVAQIGGYDSSGLYDGLYLVGGGTTQGVPAAVGASRSAAFINNVVQDAGAGYRRVMNIGSQSYADTINGGTAIDFYTSPLAPSGSGVQAAVNRMRIDRDGTVGIGTTSPSSYSANANNLVVAGSGDAIAGITVLSGATTGQGNIYFADGQTGSEAYRGRIEYTHTDDRLSFGAGGSGDVLNIASSGNVGIGYTNPDAYKLAVNGTVLLGGPTSNTRTTFLTSANIAANSLLSTATGYWAMREGATNHEIFFDTFNAGVGATPLTITQGGNIGVGTTTPLATFTLQGTNALFTNSPNGSSDTSNSFFRILNGDSSTYNNGAALALIKNTGNRGTKGHVNGSDLLRVDFSDATALIINKDGNVGIGTSTPYAPFEVAATALDAEGYAGNFNMAVTDTRTMAAGVGGGIAFRGSHTGTTPTVFGAIWTEKENATPGNVSSMMKFGPRSGGDIVTAATINSSGNFGIGMDPHTNARMKITGSGMDGVDSYVSTNTAGTIAIFGYHQGSGADRYAAYFMTAAGNSCYLSNGASWTCASDERLKNTITSVSGADALAGLSKIDGVTFNWNSDTTNDQQLGVIAQRVQEAFPQAIGETKEGYLAVQYDALIGPIISGVNELNKRTSFISNSSTSTPSFNVTALGNVGVGTTTDAYKFAVGGDMAATGFINVSTETSKTGIHYLDSTTTEDILAQLGTVQIAQYKYKTEARNNPERLGLIAENAPTLVLSADGKGVDIYKLATFTLAGVQALAAKVDAQTTRLTSLEGRLQMLEEAAVASSSTTFSFSTTTLKSALSEFGIFIENGLARFNTLVARQFVASADEDGEGSAGQGVILEGNKVFKVENKYVRESSKIFVTFTSPVEGSWYITNKEEGSFRIALSKNQDEDVTFDFFIIQTEGDFNTSTSEEAPEEEEDEPAQEEEQNDEQAPEEEEEISADAPSVSLNGSAAIQITVGEGFNDPGASATDIQDGDITGQIEIRGSVDSDVPGLYTLTYSVTDSQGLTGNASRVVTVKAADEEPAEEEEEESNEPAPVETPDAFLPSDDGEDAGDDTADDAGADEGGDTGGDSGSDTGGDTGGEAA